MIVAVTGYIGAGKTTTAHMLNQMGYAMVEADLIGHDLLSDEKILEQIRAEFGIKVLGRDLKVDRQKLSQAVFGDESQLKTLNKIMHGPLRDELYGRLQGMSGNVVVDAALYHELELDKLCDRTILVTADLNVVYERLQPNYTKEQILNIMNNQKACKKPDYTIDNNGTKEQLKSRVQQIEKLLN